MAASEADWPKLSEEAVYAGLDDPFISKLTADNDHLGELAERIDPDGLLMAWYRRHSEWCLEDPIRMVFLLRMWIQTGRLPPSLF